MLFIDEYRVKEEKDFQYATEEAKLIRSLASKKEIPHLLISGASGSGKKTLAHYFIKEKYGDDFNIKNQIYEIKHISKKIEVHVKYSKYHWQINPSIYGVYDRTIIQLLILDILKNKTISNDYHLIIIEDAHLLTKDAQQCLRRILEKYISNCRFIFLISNEVSLIGALMSRCLHVRLPAPTEKEIFNIIEKIAVEKNIEFNPERLTEIIRESERNLKKALNTFQVLNIEEKHSLTSNTSCYKDTIIDSIIKEDDIIKIRMYLFELLANCEEPIDILKNIYKKLLLIKSDEDMIKITSYLSEYENSLRLGGKPIYHLEGFMLSLKF